MAVRKSSASIAVSPVKAWSYSRLVTFLECPAKFKYKNIDKLPEPQGPALARGERIHKLAENYVKNGGILPVELSQFQVEFDQLRAVAPSLSYEMQAAFTSAWSKAEWFGKDAWCRVVIDLFQPAGRKGGTARIIDYKTGQVRGSYADQLELYALAGLLLDPMASSVSTELWFLDHGQIVDSFEKPLTRLDLPKLKRKWSTAPKRLLNETRFDPTPSASACKYCHFRKSNGGPCEY